MSIQLVVHLAAFYLYNHKFINKTTAPSKATWFLWSFLAVLNAASYLVTTSDIVKTILAMVDVAACTATFLIVWRFSGTSVFTANEKRAMVIGLVSGLVWWFFRTAFYANTIIQFAVVVSFIPTLINVWKKPSHEPQVPWLLWSAVYASNLMIVCRRWSSWHDIVHPLIYLLLHVAVWLLSARKERPPTEPSRAP